MACVLYYVFFEAVLRGDLFVPGSASEAQETNIPVKTKKRPTQWINSMCSCKTSQEKKMLLKGINPVNEPATPAGTSATPLNQNT
jgi:hypothetical protein